MGMLADFYERGFQVNKNIQKSMEIRKEAAETGDGLAIYNLAISYLNGNEITISDIDKAISLLKQAEKKGIPSASFNLGVIHLKNEKYYNLREAYKWFFITSKWKPNSSVKKMTNLTYSRIIEKSKQVLILLEKELDSETIKDIENSN